MIGTSYSDIFIIVDLTIVNLYKPLLCLILTQLKSTFCCISNNHFLNAMLRSMMKRVNTDLHI